MSNSVKNSIPLSADSALNDPDYLHYRDEAQKNWGGTNAYRQSLDRLSKMSKEDLDRIKAEGGEITLAIAKSMQAGKAPDDEQVQSSIDRHYHHLMHFYDPTYQMYQSLGQMYLDDPRFAAFYESIAAGLAVFMRDSIKYYCQKHLLGLK